jgi:nucleoid DNA-binding protein
MKKVLLTVTSGVLIALVLSNAIAMDREQLEQRITHHSEVSSAFTHTALSAFEARIKAEMLAGNRVNLSGFGTYKPEHCETLNGKEKCSLIKGGKKIGDKQIINDMARAAHTLYPNENVPKAAAGRALAAYEATLRTQLRKHDVVDIEGIETFSTKARAAKTKTLANGEIKTIPGKVFLVHAEDPTDVRYRFVAQKGLRDAMNK